LSSRERLAAASVLGLTLLTFASTFTFGWVYDDPPQIPGNANLRWDRLGYLFSHHLWASARGISNARFYRPLLEVWFLINKTVFGLHPQWFHVTTVLLHVLAVALAFLIARELLKDNAGALFTAAIFGVHPLQAESVSWISAVNDPLAAIFCFSSFLAYKKATRSDNATLWSALAVALFFCGLLTKEVSFFLPALVAVDFRLDSRSNEALPRFAFGRILSGCIVSIIVWVFIRYSVLKDVVSATSLASRTSALLTAPKILLFQLWHVVFPAGLSPHYDVRALDSANQGLLPSWGVVVLVALTAIIVRRKPALSVALAWLIFPLLATLNLRWLNEDDFVHDRYMYMSMLGVGLLASAGFAALRKRWPERRLIPGLAVALVIGLAFGSAIQSQYWANDMALFARGVQIAPQNEWAQLDYGAALSAQDKFEQAAAHFVRSYQLKPGWRAAEYAGFAYGMSHELAPAQHWYVEALRLNPGDSKAWFSLGEIRMGQDQPAAALALFRKAQELDPNGVGLHTAAGAALERLGKNDEARQEYQAELQLHPSEGEARKGLERLGPFD